MGLCDVCLGKAQACEMDRVWVFSNGHILSSSEIPSIAQWPVTSDPMTFCGLDAYGMGTSTRYRMDADPADAGRAGR